MLAIHENSPKHKKKEEAHGEVMKLKEEFLKKLEEKNNDIKTEKFEIETETDTFENVNEIETDRSENVNEIETDKSETEIKTQKEEQELELENAKID